MVSFRPPEIFFFTKRKIYNALALKMLLLWIHLIIFTKCMLLSTKENDVFDNEEIPEDFLDHGKHQMKIFIIHILKVICVFVYYQ